MIERSPAVALRSIPAPSPSLSFPLPFYSPPVCSTPFTASKRTHEVQQASKGALFEANRRCIYLFYIII